MVLDPSEWSISYRIWVVIFVSSLRFFASIAGTWKSWDMSEIITKYSKKAWMWIYHLLFLSNVSVTSWLSYKSYMNIMAFVSQEHNFIIEKWSLFLFEVSESRPRVEDLAAGRASLGFPGVALVVKNRPANAGDIRDAGSIPRPGRSPGGGHSNSLQYSCLENPHGQRSLMGYSPWGCKESNTAKGTST